MAPEQDGGPKAGRPALRSCQAHLPRDLVLSGEQAEQRQSQDLKRPSPGPFISRGLSWGPSADWSNTPPMMRAWALPVRGRGGLQQSAEKPAQTPWGSRRLEPVAPTEALRHPACCPDPAPPLTSPTLSVSTPAERQPWGPGGGPGDGQVSEGLSKRPAHLPTPASSQPWPSESAHAGSAGRGGGMMFHHTGWEGC